MSFPIDVIFAHPDAGYQGDQDHARRCGLVPGQVYQLRSMQVSQSDTYLELHGYKHERFSSVLFEPWDMSAWFLLAEMKAGAYLAGSQPHPVSTITEPELAAALASVSPGRPVTPAEEARLLVQHAEDTQDRYRYRYRRTETDDILRAIEKVDAHLDNAAPSVYRTSPTARAELNEARAVANKWRRIAGGPGCEVHEATEALLAVTGGNPRKGVHGSEEDVLSGLGDTVVAGLLAILYGIPPAVVVEAIHASNMTKTNTPDEGKLVKGPGYRPPRIAEILAGYAYFPPESGMDDQMARDNGSIG